MLQCKLPNYYQSHLKHITHSLISCLEDKATSRVTLGHFSYSFIISLLNTDIEKLCNLLANHNQIFYLLNRYQNTFCKKKFHINQILFFSMHLVTYSYTPWFDNSCYLR